MKMRLSRKDSVIHTVICAVIGAVIGIPAGILISLCLIY